jgi:hypothetical protein
MAIQRQEGFKTAGVIFSVLLSMSSFALSFFTFYFEHIKSSEAVDALLSGIDVKQDDNTKKERIIVDLVLVNKGDNPVTVSDLMFEVNDDSGTCCGRLRAFKSNEDTVIVPISLLSKHAIKISLGFSYGGFIAPVFGIRISSGEGNPSTEVIPPPAPVAVEKVSIRLSLITIGPAYGYQEMKMPIGLLHLKDNKVTSYGPSLVYSELIPVRKDPPLLKSLWHSITN